MKNKDFYVYILSNSINTIFYVGVTNDLVRRIYEHKNKLVQGFTSKYNVTKLVYFEILNSSISAIDREKQIKGGSRIKKLELIRKENPAFEDLYSKIL